MKDNIIIYVSSRNNYDMLSGEVFKNIDTEPKACLSKLIK